MYVSDDSYSSLTIFIEGYFFAIKELEGVDYSDLFRNWLFKQEGKHFVSTWSGYIYFELCSKDSKKSEEKMFELFKHYFESNSNP
jgi:hypothetical protein